MNEVVVIQNEDGTMEERFVPEGSRETLWEVGGRWNREEGQSFTVVAHGEYLL